MTIENSSAPATESTSTESTENSEATQSDNDGWDDDEPKEEPKEEAKKASTNAPEAPKKERKFRKVVVDGKEETVDEDQVFRDYQKYKSADKDKRELAEQRKRMEAFMKKFQEDPLSLLENGKVPLNRRELAEKWLKEEISRSMRDPKDIELEEKNSRLKTYEEREAAEKARVANEEATRRVEGRRQELSKVFAEAMKQSPLSKDPKHATAALREMAMYMRIARANGDEVTAEELAAHVESQKLSQFHSVADTLEGDELLNFLGDKIANKIRKADLARIRKARGEEDGTPEQRQESSWGDSTKSEKRTFIDPVTAREQVRKRLGIK